MNIMTTIKLNKSFYHGWHGCSRIFLNKKLEKFTISSNIYVTAPVAPRLSSMRTRTGLLFSPLTARQKLSTLMRELMQNFVPSTIKSGHYCTNNSEHLAINNAFNFVHYSTNKTWKVLINKNFIHHKTCRKHGENIFKNCFSFLFQEVNYART